MNHPIQSVAGALFSPDRSQILLVLRRDVPVWVLPGGGIDARESPEAAVVREILEETGFTVKIKRKVGRYYPINRLARTTELFECEIESGEMRLSDETRDVRFFPIQSLPREIPPPFSEWIDDAIAQRGCVEKRMLNVNYWTLAKYFCSHPLLVLRFLLARAGIPLNSR